MQDNMRKKCELFNENNQVVLKKFWYEFPMLNLLSSFILTDKELKADGGELKANKKMIRKNFGLFSNVRGNLMLPIAATMNTTADKNKYLEDLKKSYTAIKAGRIIKTEFDVLSAMSLAERADELNLEEVAAKSKAIYKKMGENHPLLTSFSDHATATVFAMDKRDPDKLLDDMEACYQILKPGFAFRGDEIQAMSALLALIDKPVEEKAEKAKALCKALKDRKISMNFNMCLPIVGGLTVLPGSVDEIADMVKEGEEWLRHKRGFSWLTSGKPGRITFSMMLLLSANSKLINAENTMMQSTLTNIIIQEIIIMIIILITTSSAISSSSSSSSSH